MNKKKSTEKKLISLMIKAHKLWMDYMDSVPEEGNKGGKDRAYLSLCLFRTSMAIDSTHDNTELSPEHQVSLFTVIREGEVPGKEGWRDDMEVLRGRKNGKKN